MESRKMALMNLSSRQWRCRQGMDLWTEGGEEELRESSTGNICITMCKTIMLVKKKFVQFALLNIAIRY